MEMTIGSPSPPLRMIAPRGAPIRNNNRQAMDKVNLRCHSILYLVYARFREAKSSLVDSIYDLRVRA